VAASDVEGRDSSESRSVPSEIGDVSFPVSVRGYDRRAVDAYVERVHQLLVELELTRSPEAAVKHALQRVGEQTKGILEQAGETAEQITVAARQEAEANTARATGEADDVVAKAKAEEAEILARSHAEAEATVAQARNEAAEHLQRSRNEVAALRERRRHGCASSGPTPRASGSSALGSWTTSVRSQRGSKRKPARRIHGSRPRRPPPRRRKGSPNPGRHAKPTHRGHSDGRVDRRGLGLVRTHAEGRRHLCARAPAVPH
jgi:DivIVA domain-containing protein